MYICMHVCMNVCTVCMYVCVSATEVDTAMNAMRVAMVNTSGKALWQTLLLLCGKLVSYHFVANLLSLQPWRTHEFSSCISVLNTIHVSVSCAGQAIRFKPEKLQ